MENSFVLFACVWCGPSWYTSNSNERLAFLDSLLGPGETREGTNPSPRTNIEVNL